MKRKKTGVEKGFEIGVIIIISSAITYLIIAFLTGYKNPHWYKAIGIMY